MSSNSDKKKNSAFSTTNILLACILAVVLAVAVFVVKTELGKAATGSETATEESSINIAESSKEASEEKSDKEASDKASEKTGDDEKEKESNTVSWNESEESEENSGSSEAEEEKVESISLEDFTKNNSSLPFEKDDDDMIIAFDTDDTLLVPSSDEEIEGAIEAINHLEDDGYHWCIVSANADDDKPARIQENILDLIDSDDHYLGFYIVNPGRDRFTWCNENRVDVLVDDNKDTAKFADEYRFHMLLVDGSGVEESQFLHPMKGSSPYNGFKSYLRSIKLLKSL